MALFFTSNDNNEEDDLFASDEDEEEEERNEILVDNCGGDGCESEDTSDDCESD